jgi:dTDP-4-dehydrorhamnose reductase
MEILSQARPLVRCGRLPLLITGITGVAGFNALHYFQRRYPGQVVGIRPWQTDRLVGADIVPLDAEDGPGLRKLFEQFSFRAVLHCGGNCALKACECDPPMAWRLNVGSVAALLPNVQRSTARLVALSSDLVFSGSGAGNHVETDAIDPVTVYGKTMGEAEQRLQAAYPAAAVLRISLPMGPSFNRHAGAIDWISSRFRKERPATLYFDEVRSATYTDDLNRVFEWFLASDAAGLFHAGGPRPVTLYEIGQIVNRVGGFTPGLLRGCPRRQAGPMPPRAGNVSLNSAKLRALLGYEPFHPWPVGAELWPTGRQWHLDFEGAPPGSWHGVVERLYHYPKERLAALPEPG